MRCEVDTQAAAMFALTLVLVGGCAGRTANPVMVYQPGDEGRSCVVLERELAQIEKKILTEEINELLKCLSKEESDIIKDIYGLDNTERLTLKEIAEKNNLTVEQVKQIEVQAIRKLRNSTKTNDLIIFL